jgi:hypothetical protein
MTDTSTFRQYQGKERVIVIAHFIKMISNITEKTGKFPMDLYEKYKLEFPRKEEHER